jgi:hypothetical protein
VISLMWLTWRQHRAQVLGTVAFLLVLGALVLMGGEQAYLYLSWLPVIPLVIGVFWGTPLLAKELERGTHRLAWTQSVTRGRWLVAKLGWLGLAVTVAGLLLGLMVSNWTTTYNLDRFSDTALFGGTGVVVGAWWLFSFLLGAAAGGVVRRVLPAMAVTVVVFLVAMFGFFQLRPEYAEPLRSVADSSRDIEGFVTDAAWLSPSGAEIKEVAECGAASRYLECVQAAGYRPITYYQPADRYWRFQWTEAGLLLLAAALLTGPVVYRVLRRPI